MGMKACHKATDHNKRPQCRWKLADEAFDKSIVLMLRSGRRRRGRLLYMQRKCHTELPTEAGEGTAHAITSNTFWGILRCRPTISKRKGNNLKRIGLSIIIIIIMYICHALINTLSAHMIHINLNTIFYTHIEHSQNMRACMHTRMCAHTLMHTHSMTIAETGYWY